MLQKFFAFLLFVCGIALSPSHALAAEKLDIPRGEDWVHPHSGIVFPARADGIARTKATSFAPDLLDVGMAFDTADGKDAISLYIFRNTNGGVPVWFEQGRLAIESRDPYRGAVIVAPPTAFTPAGFTNATGLKAVYSGTAGGTVLSTGIAVFAAGDWYVKIRVTSRTMGPEQLDRRIDDLVRQIDVPEALRKGPVARPVEDCTSPLELVQFPGDVDGSPEAAIEASMLVSVAFNDRDEPLPLFGRGVEQWCKEGRFGALNTSYRPAGSTDAYLFATGDNGEGVWVGPEVRLSLTGSNEADDNSAYTIVMLTAENATVYPSQNGLPSYERMAEVVNSGRFLVRVETWGEDRAVMINSAALDDDS